MDSAWSLAQQVFIPLRKEFDWSASELCTYWARVLPQITQPTIASLVDSLLRNRSSIDSWNVVSESVVSLVCRLPSEKSATVLAETLHMLSLTSLTNKDMFANAVQLQLNKIPLDPTWPTKAGALYDAYGQNQPSRFGQTLTMTDVSTNKQVVSEQLVQRLELTFRDPPDNVDWPSFISNLVRSPLLSSASAHQSRMKTSCLNLLTPMFRGDWGPFQRIVLLPYDWLPVWRAMSEEKWAMADAFIAFIQQLGQRGILQPSMVPCYVLEVLWQCPAMSSATDLTSRAVAAALQQLHSRREVAGAAAVLSEMEGALTKLFPVNSLTSKGWCFRDDMLDRARFPVAASLVTSLFLWLIPDLSAQSQPTAYLQTLRSAVLNPEARAIADALMRKFVERYFPDFSSKIETKVDLLSLAHLAPFVSTFDSKTFTSRPWMVRVDALLSYRKRTQ